ncbi:hypothetical protein D9619_013461 [Psilocybe cf. subviscida]|uniref:Uncharacterized protein n=1 Tax=Psilocybe cf. subviscida TaxID=2480587 RepID=A0A8H5BSE7_9AGAR|nr:hypothetical protein D9619_013461 [Psilocybe cf. subviscida]
MDLLVQIWRPFENSPTDRALYIWDCAQSMHAFNGVLTNEACAQKLAKKHVWQAQRERYHAKAEERSRREKQCKEVLSDGNSFAVNQTVAKAASTLPTSGAILGIDARAPGEVPASTAPVPPNETLKMTRTTKTKPHPTATPHGKRRCLIHHSVSTTSKYVLPKLKAKVSRDAFVDALLNDNDGGKGKSGKGGSEMESWAKQAYENSMDADQMFKQFI